MTTEISFYHLTQAPLEKVLPQLLLKVLDSGKRAVVIASNDNQLKQLDKLLWTFSTNKVIPHGVKSDGFEKDQPVYLTLEEENPNQAEILVVVGGNSPEFLKDFSRCLDIFNGNDNDELSNARQRWSNYKTDDSLSLAYWKQGEKGGWEKGATS